jgi:hypothetical protein
LAADLASPRERLRCLRSYLKSALGNQPALRPWVNLINRQVHSLDGRRSIRELRRPPLSGGSQRLRWIDGERLVVTRPFWRECGGVVPPWLTAAARIPVQRFQETHQVWHGRRVVLRRFPATGRLRRWWNQICGRHEVASGPRLGGQLFRQERLGLPGPEPLAFGQRPDGASFILLRLDAVDERGRPDHA